MRARPTPLTRPPRTPQQPAAIWGAAVSNTASAVGAFIAQGASAMREMNAAKKALADARAHLAELEQRIADQGEELETRQDIAGRYDQIVADQRQTIATAQKAAAAAEIGRDTHASKATELKAQLEQIKTEDDATERRLKAALDAVEAREASSRETGNRLVRRLEDSKRIRDKVKAERDAGVAAAQQTVDATRAQLETLRREYAELQRNPSANPANYTVRTSELSMQISDTADALRKAEEDVPRITADLEHSLAAAEQAVEQAQAPIADAKRAHQAVTTEADAARDELQTAKTAAATRQRELREKIAARTRHAASRSRPSPTPKQMPHMHSRSSNRRPRCTTTQKSLSRLQDPWPETKPNTPRPSKKSTSSRPPKTTYESAPATHASNSPAPSSASSPQSWRSS